VLAFDSSAFSGATATQRGEVKMKRRQQLGDLTRRRALALGAGLGLTPLQSTLAAAAEAAAPTPGAPIVTRPIPSSGERLPVIGLGTDEYYAGGAVQQAALGEVVRTLIASGGSVIDTSSDYGASETLIAATFAEGDVRQRIFIATKLERQALEQVDVEDSLHRLGISRIDLMQVHNVTSAEQSLAPLREWKAQGLVRYIGITTSVTSAFDALEAVMRREKPDFVELNYSVGDREAEKRLLPAAADLGIATLINIPFGGPGGRNLLRAAQGKPFPDWAHDFDAATWGQVLLKYVLANPAVTCVIPGTRNPEHMADNLGAGRGRLPDAGQRQQIGRFIDGLAG
jgi:aryl-alcohol dehydrogenase-like predicted oxidoreductase